MRQLNRRQFTRVDLGAQLAGGLGLGLPACERRGSSGAADRPTLKLGYLPITDHLLLIAHGYYDFQRVEVEPVKFGAGPRRALAPLCRRRRFGKNHCPSCQGQGHRRHLHRRAAA